MHLFYFDIQKNQDLRLKNEEHHHCSQVLRHQIGDIIHLTDGTGSLIEASITQIDKRSTSFKIIATTKKPGKPFYAHVAICPTKQMERMEWFVEKVTELGVDEISFLVSTNSERRIVKTDRLEKKMISAMKQSKSTWKVRINPIQNFRDFLDSTTDYPNKYIAFAEESSHYFGSLISPKERILIVIGPEGDFTPDEIKLAHEKGFSSVSLGRNILRTETAGIAAVQMINIANCY